MKTILDKLSKVVNAVVADKDQTNKFGGYGYRTKEGIISKAKPHCEKNKCVLLVSDEAVLVGAWQYIKSTASLVCIETGEQVSATAYAREPLTQKGLQEPQMSGSASSYAGKYAIGNLLNISDSSLDPDATNDHGKSKPKAVAKSNKPTKAVQKTDAFDGLM